MIFGDSRLPLRFWNKIVVLSDTGCWWWVGATVPDGYGQIRRNGKPSAAHRWAYEALVADIPHGLHVDHLCRFRACVNPGHLEPVTQRENNLRGESLQAQNARKVVCVNGHAFTEGNTYRYPDGRRSCRICRRDAVRKFKRGKDKVGGIRVRKAQKGASE